MHQFSTHPIPRVPMLPLPGLIVRHGAEPRDAVVCLAAKMLDASCASAHSADTSRRFFSLPDGRMACTRCRMQTGATPSFVAMSGQCFVPVAIVLWIGSIRSEAEPRNEIDERGRFLHIEYRTAAVSKPTNDQQQTTNNQQKNSPPRRSSRGCRPTTEKAVVEG